MVPVDMRFSEKSPSPQPFTEPENMTTIELNKNGYSVDETQTDQTLTKPKLINTKMTKSLLLGIGLFMLLGLCLGILILLIQRGYLKHLKESGGKSHVKEISLKVILKNKEKISVCKETKTFENCCYIFLKTNTFDNLEKCTVQKVLNLFLRYELEANKRMKRQNYDRGTVDYQNQFYDPEYYYDKEIYNFDNDLDQPVYDYQQNAFEAYPSENQQRVDNNYYNYHDYRYDYQEQYNQGETNNNNFDPSANLRSEKQFFETLPHVNVDTKEKLSASQDLVPSNTNPVTNFDPIVAETQPWTSSTILPKTCPDDNCPTVINATTKIGNVADLNAQPGKLIIAINDTSIRLTSKSMTSARISQNNDLVMKSTIEVPTPNQNKPVNPCFYPFPSPFAPPYRASSGYDTNPLYSMVPMNPPNIQHQPLYIINPPIYPYIPMQYQSYNTYPRAPVANRNSIQVTGPGGQYYVCNPVSLPNNAGGLQGVEIRRSSEAFNLQDLVESAPKSLKSNNTREAMDCPIGTHGCADGSKCIHNRQLCDNEVNCNDASDEMDCSCKDRVGEIRWCDGYLDCPNGEDEEGCFDCALNEFSCDDWSRFQRGTCIPISQRCDGITHCEITAKDEEDCSILTDHLGHHSFYKVSNAAGFLHRNFKGKWYPTCFGVDLFSLEVCRTEAGPTEIMPKTHLVPYNDNYFGQFLDISPSNGITLTNTCMRNSAAFVECPPLYCGVRLTITNPFRTSEVDTSAEVLLNRMQRVSKSRVAEIVGGSRVVGGKPSQPTAWPWVVSIYKNGVFHCGGVLINDIWILTAAHCVDKFWFFYYEVQAGILRRYSYSPMEQNRWAVTAIPHENYDKKSLKNDIAIMKLSKPVRFNRYVRPICLPSEATAGEDFLHGPKPNTICTTVGWGATVEHGADPDHLREVEIPILPHCKHTEDTEGDEICAGLLEGGRDACQGDSGGPLMCQNIKNRNQWYLAGIVSHGEGCARPNEPGVYTRVSKYIGWISENMNGKAVGRFPLQKCPGFICTGTKRCLPKKRRCDKIVDCLFGDDEVNCWQSRQQSTLFRSEVVGSSRRIYNDFLDLLDFDKSSEENNSVEDEEVEDDTSTSTQSQNITSDANDLSKEENKDEIVVTNFTCTYLLQTILFDKKCDRIVDCEDGTDESECSCVDYLRRYHKEAICDGITDCKDMSDEVECVKCLPDQHLCRISQKCIPLEKRCDGRAACINGEDEWDCVALTNGRTLVFDSDLRPKQSMKGIITINRFGVWRPLCTNASVDNAASIAANVCNLLGFEEYTAFHKLYVADKPLNVTIDGFDRYHSSLDELPVCGGLFVGCLNVSLADNIHELHPDNITSQVELYTLPWNAVIYSDGKFRCTGTILNSRWIIVANTCFRKIKNTYVAALVGKGKAHLDVEGPHEQILIIENYAPVEGSEAVVLRTQEKINFNRYVKSTQTTAKSVLIKELCVATSFYDEKSKFVILRSTKECTTGFRCFKPPEDSCKKVAEPWSGVITCNSRAGWYPAAIFTNISDVCDFSNHEFANLNQIKIALAMGNDVQAIFPQECDGFRCILGKCIERKQMCNGFPDCRAGEDEDMDMCTKSRSECHLRSNCTNFSFCSWSELKCSDGDCVPKTSFCDTINDCEDKSDEPAECSCGTYLEIAHPEKICDGTVNCMDRSDENPKKCGCKFPTNVTCGRTKLCISQEMVCDGFEDCPGGEDESRCYSFKTNLASISSGEVMKRTAGVWHSGCFARNHTMSELEEICERLGFAGGSARQLIPPEDTNNVATNPVMDRFDIVWIRRGEGSELKLQLRTGNEPYVRFMEDSNCHKLYVECL